VDEVVAAPKAFAWIAMNVSSVIPVIARNAWMT
jgi:hypothetical protein